MEIFKNAIFRPSLDYQKGKNIRLLCLTQQKFRNFRKKKLKENEIKRNAVKHKIMHVRGNSKRKAKEKTKIPSLEKSNDGVKMA